MVVMSGEYEATVVSASVHLRDHIVARVAFKKFIFNVKTDVPGVFRKVGRDPDDRLLHNLFTVGLVEFQRLVPNVNHSGVLAALPAFKSLEDILMPVSELEIADNAPRLAGLHRSSVIFARLKFRVSM